MKRNYANLMFDMAIVFIIAADSKLYVCYGYFAIHIYNRINCIIYFDIHIQKNQMYNLYCIKRERENIRKLGRGRSYLYNHIGGKIYAFAYTIFSRFIQT